MSDKYPWPRAGDALFAEGDWTLNACRGWSHDQWFGISEGFRRAGDVLVQRCIDHRSDLDFLIHPIVFNYRQAIELALKHVWVVGSQLLDRDVTVPKKHDLAMLWTRCRELIEEIFSGEPTTDLDAVGEVINQFAARDPNSTTFRYPDPGAPSERIDVCNFGEVVNRAFALLDACASQIREYQQAKWEMAREYSP
jgi:hypothetical protein